jgi:sporulation protein YlmC with PRC-barrel domain
MRIQLGEQILTADGRDAARVDKVILDPNRGDVASIVLRKGTIFPHDVEVTLDQITEDVAGNHRLVLDTAQLDELPRFDETTYTAPPPDLVLPYEDLRDAALWPTGWLGTPVPARVLPLGGERTLPAEVVARLYEQDMENAVIVSGSAILSRDGEKVGELARLTFSENDGRLHSLVIRHGFLFPKEVELPGSLVDSAGDGVLYLNVDRERVAELAEIGQFSNPSRS